MNVMTVAIGQEVEGRFNRRRGPWRRWQRREDGWWYFNVHYKAWHRYLRRPGEVREPTGKEPTSG